MSLDEKYTVRRMLPDELDDCLALAWKTFLEFEAPDYSSEGVETFRRDIIDNAEFKAKCRSGQARVWGAFDQTRPVCVIAMRNDSHICLVFTDSDHHRQGLATAVMDRLISDVRTENPGLKSITLNSSPYGKPFYLRYGFAATDNEQEQNGIRYTPMQYALR